MLTKFLRHILLKIKAPCILKAYTLEILLAFKVLLVLNLASLLQTNMTTRIALYIVLHCDFNTKVNFKLEIRDFI